jgi:subtilisin family serine protease
MSDDSVSVLSLPFEFPYFDDSFSHAYLSSNGLMSFYYTSSAARDSGSGGEDAATFAKRQSGDADDSELVDGTFIVVLRRELGAKHVEIVADHVRSRHADVTASSFQAQVKSVHSHLRMLTVHAPSDEALRFLSGHEHVLSVEPNRRVSVVGDHLRAEPRPSPARALTSSPYSWGLDRIDQASLPLDQATYVPPADSNGGARVDVFVVDTGLDTTHAEFSNTGARTVANLYNGYGNVTEDTDRHGHGSHCAGTAGGINVGVAPMANIYGVKVLSDSGSGSSTIVDGLELVLARRVADPARPMVVSMSLGGYCGTGCGTSSMNLAVNELSAAEITVMMAAGNSAADACERTPASASTAVTVGSTTSADAVSSFSSIGSCVDILAPGSSILSACASNSSASCVNGDS